MGHPFPACCKPSPAGWDGNKGKTAPPPLGSLIWGHEERTIKNLWLRSTHLSTNHEELGGRKVISSTSSFPSCRSFLTSLSFLEGRQRRPWAQLWLSCPCVQVILEELREAYTADPWQNEEGKASLHHSHEFCGTVTVLRVPCSPRCCKDEGLFTRSMSASLEAESQMEILV